MQHADHLGAFLVDRGRIEIADFLITFRADRVRHGPAVFGELRRAKRHDIIDALDRARARRGMRGQVAGHHVGRELLVAKDGQPFLETQLKPVPARDPVAGPVMEVFMADHCLDGLVVRISGSRRIGKHIGRVKDVQALVFHGAHVEVPRGDDHEPVEVQLKPEAPFIPAHGSLERFHGPGGLAFGSRVAVHLQQHLAPAASGHPVLPAGERARYQGKKVAGLGERIVPHRFVVAVSKVALSHQVAVGQQHGKTAAVCAQRNPVCGHDVRPVGEPADAAKPLGFALCEQCGPGNVESAETGVFNRPARADNFDKRFIRHIVQGESGVADGVLAVDEGDAVHVHGNERQVFPVELKMAYAGGWLLASHGEPCAQPGEIGIQVEFQFDLRNFKRKWLVVLAVDGRSDFGAHRDSRYRPDNCSLSAICL